jgi:hypothetical protein
MPPLQVAWHGKGFHWLKTSVDILGFFVLEESVGTHHWTHHRRNPNSAGFYLKPDR